MTGPKLVNRYPNIGVAKCGTSVCGVYSAQYSLNQNIKSIFSTGDKNPTVTYSELPNIELTYSQYLTYFDLDYNDFNTASKLELISRDQTIICDNAFLTKLSYSFTTDSPFTVTQTYTGYTKPLKSSLTPACIESEERHIFHRQDFDGTFPPGIASSAISSINIEISINRQIIGEFATRKPYASYVTFPITRSIKYECYNDGVDTYVLESIKEACGTTQEPTYDLTVSACSKSITIDNAYLTELSYGGADAGRGSQPQMVSIGFTSYDSIGQIDPVYFFPDSWESC